MKWVSSRKLHRRAWGALVGAAVICGSVLPAAALDFDGDGEHDLTVFTPNTGSGSGEFAFASSLQDVTREYVWGQRRDFPVPGKYTSTTGPDFAVWRRSDGVWYIRKFSSDFAFDTASSFEWGNRNDRPHPCDFNGDGLNELAVVRTGRRDLTWFLRNSTSSASTSFSTANSQKWGRKNDKPIPYDYDGDGECDFAVYRNGDWFIILSTTNGTDASVVPWGKRGDTPVPGQYTADSIADYAVFRPRRNSQGGPLWIVRESDTAGLTSETYQWGNQGDLPVPFDYDGDGKTDIAVWRPSNAVWYIRTSGSSYATALSLQFGSVGDIPVGDRRGKDPA